MPFDYKKEYHAFYQPPKVPEIIDVPDCLLYTSPSPRDTR